MDDFFKKSILFDIYGGILNKKQKIVYEYHIIDDLSFNEIGKELNISRQAAYDLYLNADRKLIEIDEKLHLLKKFENIEEYANAIFKKTDKLVIKKLSNKILNIVLKEDKK